MNLSGEIYPSILVIGSGDDINIKLLMDWLVFLNADVFCINASTDELFIRHYDLQNGKLQVEINSNREKTTLDLTNLKVTFHRACKLKFKEAQNPFPEYSNNGWRDYNIVMKRNLDSFLEHYLRQNSFFIGSWESGLLNKIIVLEKAKKIGFIVPDSYLLTELKNINLDEHYISKSFGLSFHGETHDSLFSCYTGRLNTHLEMPLFMTSLVQHEIKKRFEIRAFVFLDEIFCMAIFSQMNDQSSVDYRIYDTSNPYLNEPYQLPVTIQKKIFELMQELNLNTGSVDLIYTTKGEYVFLEVNPDGQFGYLGYVNGLDLYQVIAQKMMSYVNN